MAEPETKAVVGGITDAPEAKENSLLTEEIGRYAIDEYNKKSNALLEFSSVVSVKEQVVSGTIYYLTIEAVESGEKKLYQAKVWVKPWINFKELQDFKPIADSEETSTATATV
ncbi:Cysteine proteinase inhibitor [Rhynchospora pubera]|uniref:Cysteine proteinase inhibitor n=1 Tax=Rhynchospora pubera TaxID=906938 RepID=A0AAV8EN57_9POAL|nr:Cysteine proteinase inhibitor [Rhynchospora pubera]KAJ4780237.1 Cysteine proteinase inhibitor [Rhynchospora pubera]KAJ4787116.1 Cysteine proteinase inhibitor [Rhynchospora pubera]